MNERGFASLTAIIIILVLAYLITGTSFTAGNFVDMTRNFEVENQLQLAAESAFDMELAVWNEKVVETADAMLSSYPKNYNTFKGADAVMVNVRKTADEKIIILAIAKKNNYLGDKIHAFRSVGGFLEKTLIKTEVPSEVEGEPSVEEEYQIYEFKGYLHKMI